MAQASFTGLAKEPFSYVAFPMTNAVRRSSVAVVGTIFSAGMPGAYTCWCHRPSPGVESPAEVLRRSGYPCTLCIATLHPLCCSR